ncbi:MAG: acyltransferase [Acidobacteriota bacterium]
MPSAPDPTVAGNTPETRPENRAFYPALDGLRAIAFLLVFFQHYPVGRFGIPWGWTGVQFFFVLSGFLITGILYDTRNHPHRVRNFYLRRTLRIFPLYYGVMLFILLLYPFAHWRIDWRWLAWPAYLGNYLRFISPSAMIVGTPWQSLADFQPANHHIALFLGHFWSLCVEEQFYLFWPAVVFLIRDRRKLLWLCALTVPLGLAARLTGQHLFAPWLLQQEILYRATPFCLDSLLLGGLLALLLRGPIAPHLLRFARYLTPIVFLVGAWWIHLVLLRNYIYPTWMFTWGLTFVNLLAALVILIAVQRETFLYRALSLSPLRWIGRISYGAYVLHDIPHLIYRATAQTFYHSHPTRTTALLALPCTLLLAWLSYRFFESPFLRLKDRWTIP